MKLDNSLETRLFINGDFVNSTGSNLIEVVNPATEELIAKVPEASVEDVDVAVKAAKKAFVKWGLATNASTRGDLLFRLADLVEINKETFAHMESMNVGKPIKQAMGDMYAVVQFIRYYAGWADKISGRTIPLDPNKFQCFTRREPVGVVAMIVPWNYPLYLAAGKIAPALACGCTCILKTSEKTPLTTAKFAHLIKEAGFPPGVVNIIAGYGPSVGEPLASHPLVDKVSFTGSTRVGKILSKIAADSFKRITLELGGKSPIIVMDDADIELAAETACNAIIVANTGQCCVASSRILVQKKVYGDFLKALKTQVEKCRLCSPKEESCNIGSIVDKIQYDRVCNYLKKGKEEGATVYCGGNPVNGKGYFVQPTIFSDVKDDMTICKEEIFGPVVVVQKFDTVDEAVQRANDTEYGLGAGICTRDIALGYQVCNRLRAGSVFINCYKEHGVNSPFGGFKHSGIGREWGEEGLEPYLEIKAVFTRVNISPGTLTD